MQRHSALHILSHEHHHALVLCRQIRKMIENGDNLENIRELILTDWEDELMDHFGDEEQVLEPYWTSKVFNKEILENIHRDHHTLRLTIYLIKNGSKDQDLFLEFSDRLTEHIRFEENTWYPEIETSLSDDELAEIGEELNRRRMEFLL